MSKITNDVDIRTLPKWEFNNFCEYIIQATEEYMKDPENQKRFKEWKAERERTKAEKEQ